MDTKAVLPATKHPRNVWDPGCHVGEFELCDEVSKVVEATMFFCFLLAVFAFRSRRSSHFSFVFLESSLSFLSHLTSGWFSKSLPTAAIRQEVRQRNFQTNADQTENTGIATNNDVVLASWQLFYLSAYRHSFLFSGCGRRVFASSLPCVPVWCHVTSAFHRRQRH